MGATSSSPLTVIEANEIPLSIFRWYSRLRPRSTVAEILRRHHATESFVEESPDRELYPSQTWATFATGIGYEKHGIYWYGDPKPAEFPLYWQLAAQHVSVGIAGTLHSSPLSAQGGQPGLRFALPDAFATDADTLPTSLSGLQQFNLDMTRGNSRAVGSTFPVGAYAAGVSAVARVARLRTMAELGQMATLVAAGKINRERLRTGQFLLMGDAFARQLRKHQPTLAIFFTNHVAAAMHRYWPASFPNEWVDHPYDDDWIGRFRDEIPAAMDAFDRFLGEQLAFCQATNRRLLVVTSMGQRGGEALDSIEDQVLVVDDAGRFASALGVVAPFELLHAMVPHLSLRFADTDTARAEERRLQAVTLDGRTLRIDRAQSTVTVTYHLPEAAERLTFAPSSDQPARLLTPAQVGLRWLEVNEHRAGRHMPFGSVLLANAPRASFDEEPVDLLELAPAILQSIGVRPAPHHREPRVSLG